MKNERAVDRAARRLHQQAFSIIDCLQCANCFWTISPTLTSRDIARIAAHLEMGVPAFKSEYLVKSEDWGLWEPKSWPCPFLGTDNRCAIYEVRPASCAEYAHTDKPGFVSRMYAHADNALQCPAVFYIVEQLRIRKLN